jgi:hypothetical protein
MVHNVNVSKKQHMIKPTKLFPLPQDVYYQQNKKVEILPPEMVREIAANFGKHKKAQNS